MKAEVRLIRKKTVGGEITGFSQNGTEYYRNIRYGSARRWHPASAYTWEGVRDCTHYGPVAPLPNQGGIDDDLFVPHRYWPTSEEECLNLNVTVPENCENEKLPVIAAYYGGSFETGSAIEMKAYDGTNLAKEGRVVYVTFNTRINILGFFDLECFGPEYFNSGNLGFQDALLALQWIRENISVFGGDPENVTLIGMQGGALRIRYMMECSAFKGLFHKVLLISGAADHGRPPEAEKFHHLAKCMLKQAGLPEDDIGPLEKLSYEELILLYKKTIKAENIKLRWRVVINGWCTGRPEDDGIAPGMDDLTVVCGNTFAENSFSPEDNLNGRMSIEEFEKEGHIRFGEAFAAAREAFAEAYPDADVRDMLYFGTDHRAAVFDYADALSDAGMKVYTYLFAPEFPFAGGIPAFHCSDVSYLMKNTDMIPALHIPGLTEQLSEDYSSMLLNLAHSGTPSVGRLEHWRAYSKSDRFTLMFGGRTGTGSVYDQKFVDYALKHLPGKN